MEGSDPIRDDTKRLGELECGCNLENAVVCIGTSGGNCLNKNWDCFEGPMIGGLRSSLSHLDFSAFEVTIASPWSHHKWSMHNAISIMREKRNNFSLNT